MAALWLLVLVAAITISSFVATPTSASVAPSSPLGQGHRVTSVYEYPDGRGFVADLEVIEQSTLYGPDINELRMTVRYAPRHRSTHRTRNLAIGLGTICSR